MVTQIAREISHAAWSPYLVATLLPGSSSFSIYKHKWPKPQIAQKRSNNRGTRQRPQISNFLSKQMGCTSDKKSKVQLCTIGEAIRGPTKKDLN
jgi:hypothetical protein